MGRTGKAAPLGKNSVGGESLVMSASPAPGVDGTVQERGEPEHPAGVAGHGTPQDQEHLGMGDHLTPALAESHPLEGDSYVERREGREDKWS